MPSKIGFLFNTKLGLLVSVAGGAMLLTFTLAQNRSEKHLGEEPNIRTPDNANSLPANSEQPLTYQPRAGTRYIYSFRRAISFEGDFAGTKIQPVSYGGEFYVDVLEADSHSFEAVLSDSIQGVNALRSPLLRIKAQSRGEEVNLLVAATKSDDEKQHLSVIKDLLSLWLFPLRADTIGTFNAKFESLAAEKGFARQKKTKLEYLSRSATNPILLKSEHHLLWREALHLPAEVKGVESTRMGSGTAALLATSRYELRFRDQAPLPSFIQADLNKLREAESLALQSGSVDLSKHPDYAKLDWNQLTSQLRDLEKLGGGKQLELFGDLLKYLRMHPEKVGELSDQLRDPSLLQQGSNSILFRVLVGTLATFGSSEALAALRDAYQDPALRSVSGKSTILAALTTTQSAIDTPTREFLAQKMETERDPHLSQGAAFALGSALQNASDEQATRAIQQIEANWKRESETHNNSEQLALLDVMGNSGRSEFLADLRAVLSSTAESNLKAKALFAMRFIKENSAQQELIQRLTDQQLALREAAAEAMAVGDWNERFRAPLESCAKTEIVTRIQQSCAKTLANNPLLAQSR